MATKPAPSINSVSCRCPDLSFKRCLLPTGLKNDPKRAQGRSLSSKERTVHGWPTGDDGHQLMMATPSARQEVERFWEEKQHTKSWGWGEVALLAWDLCLAPQPHRVLQRRSAFFNTGLLVRDTVFSLVLPNAGEGSAGEEGNQTAPRTGWTSASGRQGGKQLAGDVWCELPLVIHI